MYFYRQVRLDHLLCPPFPASHLSRGCSPQQCPPCPCQAFPFPCPPLCLQCQAWQRPCSQLCQAWCHSIPGRLQLAVCLPRQIAEEIVALLHQEVQVQTHMTEGIEDQATGTPAQLLGANEGWAQEDQAQLEAIVATEIGENIRTTETEITDTTVAMAGTPHLIGFSPSCSTSRQITFMQFLWEYLKFKWLLIWHCQGLNEPQIYNFSLKGILTEATGVIRVLAHGRYITFLELIERINPLRSRYSPREERDRPAAAGGRADHLKTNTPGKSGSALSLLFWRKKKFWLQNYFWYLVSISCVLKGRLKKVWSFAEPPIFLLRMN